jgi:transposase InsO family protein
MIFFGEASLRTAVQNFVEHYHSERNHQGLDYNVTFHPTAAWVVQQLREAFSEAGPHRYVIFDHDAIFSNEVVGLLKATGLTPKRTSIQAPWQNGIAERWVGSCRREVPDHVIPINEKHLRRLVGDSVAYFHEDRIPDSLAKDTPLHREVEQRPSREAMEVSHLRLGGLHHHYTWRYTWRQAA